MQSIDKFLSYLKPKDFILDLGCGVGRDSKYFLDHGYNVIAVEGNKELAQIAAEYTGLKIQNLQTDELDYKSCFAGIWARTYLLNVYKQDLSNALDLIAQALMPHGYAYFSFKYAQSSSGNSLVANFTEMSFKEFFKAVTEFEIIDLWVDYDNRPCSNDKWLNVIVRLK